jgi:hypothetical protein
MNHSWGTQVGGLGIALVTAVAMVSQCLWFDCGNPGWGSGHGLGKQYALQSCRQYGPCRVSRTFCSNE